MTYFPHEFRPKQAEILSVIVGILRQYANLLPLSVRRVYYALVSQPDPLIPSGLKGYSQVKYILKEARYSGKVPFEHIYDSTRQTYNLPLSLQDLLPHYYPDAFENQHAYIEVMPEKHGQAYFYTKVLRDLFIPVTPMGGNDSLSNLMDVAERLHRYQDRQRHVFLHTDFDPAGDDMLRDVSFRLAKSLMILKERPIEFDPKRKTAQMPNLQVTKTLLTIDQVKDLGLPISPFKKEKGKKEDTKKGVFVEKYGDIGFVEMESIPLDIHPKMILEPILPLLDMNEIERARIRHGRMMTEGPDILRALESSLSLSGVEDST